MTKAELQAELEALRAKLATKGDKAPASVKDALLEIARRGDPFSSRLAAEALADLA